MGKLPVVCPYNRTLGNDENELSSQEKTWRKHLYDLVKKAALTEKDAHCMIPIT
jgi:hypothetical protein